MRKLLVLAALAFTLAAPNAVQADGFFRKGCGGGGCNSGGCNSGSCNNGVGSGAAKNKIDQYGFKKGLAPRAAPWYLYWPYPAYFNYPAPTGVAFGPDHMSPNGFHPNMYHGMQFMPYPTNGFGQ